MNKNLKEVQKEVKAKQQELIDLETKARKLKAEPKAKRFVNAFLASDEVCEALVNLTNAEVTSKYTTLDNGKQSATDKISRMERVKREQGEYVWRDDLKARVHAAMEMSKSESDFLDCLKANGVDATRKTSKKYGEYYTYELLDTSKAPERAKLLNRKLLGRSYKLGTAYGLDVLRDVLKVKATKEQPKPTKVEKMQDETQENSVMLFSDWCSINGESYTDENDDMDWEKYEELQERYKSDLRSENESAEEMTNDELETPYEAVTLVELPDTDSNSKVDVEEVKCKQEVKRQTVIHEKKEAEKKLKKRGREVSSQLEDICNQSSDKVGANEYQ